MTEAHRLKSVNIPQFVQGTYILPSESIIVSCFCDIWGLVRDNLFTEIMASAFVTETFEKLRKQVESLGLDEKQKNKFFLEEWKRLCGAEERRAIREAEERKAVLAAEAKEAQRKRDMKAEEAQRKRDMEAEEAQRVREFELEN